MYENSPWLSSHPHKVTAVDLDKGSLLAFKLLPPAPQEQKDAARCEKRAASLLQLDTTRWTVHLCLHRYTGSRWLLITPEICTSLQLEAGCYDALKIPWYTVSLQQLPQLSHELLCRGGCRLQQAVTAMHEVHLLRTDLKAANVFVDSSGAWFLGDFGASNLFGNKIRFCTEVTF